MDTNTTDTDTYCEITWGENERPGDFNDYSAQPWPSIWDKPGCGPLVWMDEE